MAKEKKRSEGEGCVVLSFPVRRKAGASSSKPSSKGRVDDRDCWDENPMAASLMRSIERSFSSVSGVRGVVFDVDPGCGLPAVFFDLRERIPSAATISALASRLAEISGRRVLWLSSSTFSVDYALEADPASDDFRPSAFTASALRMMSPPMAVPLSAVLISLAPARMISPSVVESS
jgi:hypothetical protein